MPPATSSYLNQPNRTEEQARAERERARRLEQHGSAFCRQVLDASYRRVYDPAASVDPRYVLVDNDGCAPNGVKLVGMSFDEAFEAAQKRIVRLRVVGEVNV